MMLGRFGCVHSLMVCLYMADGDGNDGRVPCMCVLCSIPQDRVLQLETQLRQRDSEVESALAAASAAGGRDKQVCVCLILLRTNFNQHLLGPRAWSVAVQLGAECHPPKPLPQAAVQRQCQGSDMAVVGGDPADTLPLPSFLFPPSSLHPSSLQVASLMAKVSALEAQNSQLRVAAAKREQVLQQSRKFIEGHLARWSPGSAGAGGGGSTATAAAAAAAAGGGGGPPASGGGAASNGVGREANGTKGGPPFNPGRQ